MAGQLGILLFSLAGGWLFDNVSPVSPFILIGGLDFSYAVLVIIASLCTKISVTQTPSVKILKSNKISSFDPGQ